MRCPVCNFDNPDGVAFCGHCGNKLVQPVTPVAPQQPVQQYVQQPVQQPVQPSPQPYYQPSYNNVPPKSGGLSGGQKGAILGLLGVIVILLFVAVLARGGSEPSTILDPPTTTARKQVEDTRTIMIYLDGTNLESSGGIASAELDAIDPAKVDLSKTTVLVYTGGTKQWYNGISNTENAIYKLTETGFEKVKTYARLDMASPSTLSSFLNYGYDNHKAGHMDLVLFDHGSGTLGAIHDEFTGNRISLEGFKKALNNSPFKGDNKLELIAFRTCLNGTIENAITFVDYADYLVASEDVTWGSRATNVFGNFINDLSPSSDGIETGKRFIQAYKTNIDVLHSYGGNYLVTYAVIDLSKVNKLAQEYQKFMNSIDVSKDYNGLSRVRSKMLQFAMTSDSSATEYDTVDMYDFVKQLYQDSSVNTSSPDAFYNAFKETIKYYYTNGPIGQTNGLSVYFPYNAQSYIREIFLTEYKDISSLKDYYKLINNFNQILNGEKPSSFNFNNSSSSTSSSNEVTLELSEEQKNNYVSAYYYLFRRDEKNPKFFHRIYQSLDVDLSEPGKLKTKIGKNLVQVKDEGKYHYVVVLRTKSGDVINDKIPAILYDSEGALSSGLIGVVNNKDKPYFADVVPSGNRDQRFNGIVTDFNNFRTVDIMEQKYEILDKNGKLLPDDEWGKPGTMSGIEFTGFKAKDHNDEIETRYTGLDDGEFYVVFYIKDINNKTHQSELIKVGK